MKPSLIITGLMGAVFLMLYYAPVSHAPSPSDPAEEVAASPYVTIGSAKIFAEIARDEAALRKGLSGRIRLGPDQGMLFVFPKPERYRFWMPDMHFPIDIIWIVDGKIIGIHHSVPPESNPASPRFYRPPKPAQYVLEVNAGFAKNKNVKAGDSVTFYNID